jgi:hypothetical protein
LLTFGPAFPWEDRQRFQQQRGEDEKCMSVHYSLSQFAGFICR